MLAAGIVTTVAAGSLLGVASAATSSSDPQGGLIDKLVSKFNLNKEEVQAVFDEAHEERHAEMEAKRSEHLQELVDAGTITAEQKTALEAKFEEMHTNREALRDQDLTEEERRTKMDEARDAFESWAEQQGIDLDAIRPEGGRGGMGHQGGPRGF